MLSHIGLTTELLFIDASVQDHNLLLKNVNPNVQAHVLNPEQDGIRQITEILARYQHQHAPLQLHIVTHGSPGSLTLGATELGLGTLENYRHTLQTWGASLSQIFLYACNVASGDAGEELLVKLHQMTDATIHASTTKVGNTALGGSWVLNAIVSAEGNDDDNAVVFQRNENTEISEHLPFTDVATESYAGILVDTDGDTIDDEDDLDDDNDGIPDALEGPEPTDSGQDGSYDAAQVNFDITGTTLNAIEIDGVTFTDLTTPDTYTSSFSNPPDASGIYVINNGVEEADFGSSGASWDSTAITPFTSRDLNYYQGIDTGVSGTDFFELGYDTPVITTSGMFVAFTERNGNNPVGLQAFDADGNQLGAPVSVVLGDYIDMGIDVTFGNNQTQALKVAIYPLDDLAPVGSAIASIRVIPAANNGDAGDGKVFIFGDNTIQRSLDTDGDGIPNRVDLDSDNDGISDLVESGQDAATVDQDNNGIRDDIDGNPGANDTNQDGLADAVSGANEVVPANSDNDSIPDYLDLDADNDGIPDVVEAQPTLGYTTNGIVTNSDSDGDGVIDVYDASSTFGGTFTPPENTDLIGLPDYADTDSDEDGILDIDESGLTLLGQDLDGDGIDDGVGASYADPDGQVNTPFTFLENSDQDRSDVDYRSLDAIPPTAVDDAVTAVPGVPVPINPLLNDTDDGTLVPSTVVLVNPPVGSTLSPNGKTLIVPGEGTWTVNITTGVITFNPITGFTDNPTAVEYTVQDDDSATSTPATVSINYTSGPPTAANDALTSPPGTPATLDPLTNDSDNGTLDPTTVIFTTPPTGSNLSNDGKTLIVPGEGTWTINLTTGAITFTPEPNFTDNPTPVQYTVNDDEGLTSNAATVRVNFGIPEPPTAVNDSLIALEGTPATINILNNDSDDGTIDPTTVVFTTPPIGSTVSNGGKTLVVPGEGTWTINVTTGVIVFTPNAAFTDDPTPVQYTVNDDEGLTSNPATVTVTYAPAGTIPPVADNDVAQITDADRGQQGQVDIFANDRDADGTLDPTSVVFVNIPNGSRLSPDAKTLIVPGEGAWEIDPSTGIMTFTPNANFQGNPTPVQYTVDDNDGLTSNPATVSFAASAVGGFRIRRLSGFSDPDVFTDNPDVTADRQTEILKEERFLLSGGGRADTIRGTRNDDVISGGSNDDTLLGRKGNDIISGGSGDDTIKGASGNDILNGGAGEDRIRGGRGRDTITGSDGDDKLFGNQKKDTIDGGAGDDLIDGGRGRDVLTGGEDQDTFRYRSSRDFGDVITDFEILKDDIDLKRINTIGSMDDLKLVQNGDDAVVQGSIGQRFKTIATLEQVDIGDLNESNFRF